MSICICMIYVYILFCQLFSGLTWSFVCVEWIFLLEIWELMRFWLSRFAIWKTFFFIFPVVIRRGHDKVMDSQSDFHRLRCRALRAVMLIVPISSDDGLNNHCQFWREVLKICAKIGKIHGVGAKIGLIGAKIHYSFCLPVMSASILLQDTKGLAWCYGVWHNFVHVKQKLARNLAKFHEFAPK